MAKPQVKDGFTPIPDKILDALARTRIPGEARQVLDAVIRKTCGWGKPSDKISLSQFMNMTGLSKVAICKGINKLLEMNIITKKGNDLVTTYSIQKDYDNWRTLPKKVTSKHVTQKGNPTLPKKVHTINNIIYKKYSPNSNEIRMAQLLFSLIQKRNTGHKKPNMQKWAMHIERMIRLDNRSIENIEKIIYWCQENDFWQNNILSTEKLREKYDQLMLKMESENGRANRGSGVVL
jgi:phage replication O-like protein O